MGKHTTPSPTKYPPLILFIDSQLTTTEFQQVFNEHTHLVAVKTASGANVYSRESIDRLNIKPGAMRELMNDEPFTKQDIITLQDPLNIEQRDLSQFDYVKRELKTSDCTSQSSSTRLEWETD